MKSGKIIIKGCRQHNLKNIDLELPRNKLIIITGLSGSGKSSLAFDTLYAEGQRRYVESLSTYARQFLERMEKPDADLIEGLSPAIAIEQKTSSANPRSTVGTVTEIYDFIRLLFARAGRLYCYKCRAPVLSITIDEIVDKVLELPDKSKIIVLSPIIKDQKGSHLGLVKKLRKDGFSRLRIDGKILNIDDTAQFKNQVKKLLNKNKKHCIDVVVDRLIIKPKIKNRLADSLELAFGQSGGLVEIDIVQKESLVFNEKPVCLNCNITYNDFTPASFSFNSPQGACPECDGLGITTEFEPDLIVPNPELSLRDGAVSVWANRNSVHFNEFLEALASHYKAEIYTPFNQLPETFTQVLFYGSGNEEISFYFEKQGRRFEYKKPFEGIIPRLKEKYLETSSSYSKEEIAQYMKTKPCPACKGARLNPVSKAVKLGDKEIWEVTALSINRAVRYFNDMADVLKGKQGLIAKRIIKEILERLEFLENVGLGYLTLDRSSNTLSGGENQRIRLATQIGSKLTGVLYVLDEPSIGLHQRDNRRLLSTLLKMRDLGNTVLVVEHDAESILAADYVVDMGPGAGDKGGEVVFSGTPDSILNDEKSLTGKYLSGKRTIDVHQGRKIDINKAISIFGASGNNLKNVNVRFPLGCLVCVTGVSGSGKSTLVLETLYNALAQKLYRTRISSGAYEQISGIEEIDKVINIDQSPIGRTPRSNPGTYTGLFTHIRELLSKVPEARIRGYKPGRFSFNVKGGRCEACRGDGIVKIEMHFLPDIYAPCDICQGRRYNRETLEIRYKGKNIAEILEMTVDQALVFYENISSISTKLKTLADVGLGYIRMGQPATTLSGGEAQRVKLAKELSKRATGKTVYILDEPTTGLHFEDIQKLMIVLNRLADMGNTIIIIEHNLDVIKSADYIIDLGPEGGDKGGQVVGCGTPVQICEIPGSYTGMFLKNVL